ncbi:hypothetical protein CQA53_10060 [Helicobacter didelphidarum]|uniref:Uncharacterized protein n=2 Tax=Helicobacter didelphidarum TaxID=2040648 RepID=A0A3D8I9P1_9HELI|nr:hypothetical protein [Helicobacter didelphidarum]RDU61474.1 hypothetical protein CQA53_10060 [Helicobacter didelphidarum]
MKQDSHKTTKRFDPLLFNGLGSERERWWNNTLYSIISICGAFFTHIGIYLLYGISVKWYYQNWFLISYVIIMFIFIIFFAIWCYVHILMFKHTRKNKHIDKSNPLLICEYKGSFKNYCVWILGFMVIFIWYVPLIFLTILIQPFIASILLHLYISKPFLLKRILLFEDCVVLEYRIFGNMKLSRENLALMAIPTPLKNLAFVRPQFFTQDKYPHIMANFCTRFNPFGMSNIEQLRNELDSKIGFSAYKMTKDKWVISNDLGLKNFFNCLKIYL